MDERLQDWIVIGRIARPFGVRGEVRVELLTDFPERFKSLDRVFLGPAWERHDVERTRRHSGQVLMKLAGVDDPEGARALAGREIAVPRSEAMPLPEGHYYLEELIGMAALTTDGRELGTVTDVLRTGSNDVYVVNEGRHALLIPAIKDAIARLDLEGRRVVVESWVLESEG